MNEVLRTISERYTCRAYTGETVEREKLESISLAGVQAPSAIKSQRWRILVITNKQLIEELDDITLDLLKHAENTAAYERILSRGGKSLYDAPAVFLVLTDSDGGFSPELDCGIVVENMALAATSLGLGSCVNAMCGMPFSAPDSSTSESIKARVSWPEGWRFTIGLLVGYAAQKGQPHEPDESKIIWA
jgi:nitroreductase